MHVNLCDLLDDLTEISQVYKKVKSKMNPCDNSKERCRDFDRLNNVFLDYLILRISFYNVLCNEGKHEV